MFYAIRCALQWCRMLEVAETATFRIFIAENILMSSEGAIMNLINHNAVRYTCQHRSLR